MLNLKTEHVPPLLSPTGVQTEFDLWNLLLDMDKGSPPHSRPPAGSSRRGAPSDARPLSASPIPANATPGPGTATTQGHTGQVPGWHSQPPSVPPNAGPGNIDEVARALRTIQDAYPFLVQSVAYHQQGRPNQFPPTAPPPLTSQPPWPSTQPSTSHGAPASQYTPGFGQLAPLGINYSPPNALHPYSTPQLSTPHTISPGQSSFQAVMAGQSPEGAPVDAEGTAEDKRKRNTAASARFRVKKKVQTHNLERTVTDLSGRVDELEQEASDLRRENGWLKEIVMLKSGKARGGELLMAGPSHTRSSQGPHEDDGARDSEEGGSV